MHPFLRLAASAFAGLSISIATAHAAPTPWPQNRGDVRPDPGARFGELANGMRYVLLRNATPSHQVAVRLRIGAGSAAETDDQQGLAHFLEHMAFKGSTHVPEGQMVKILERHGLAFGPDTNAQTGWTQTVFMLDLPENDAASIDLGLMLMRETASELTLSQTAMDPERGVVLSEERLRDTPGYEAEKARLGFLLKGQLVPTRFPIGKVAVIRTAPASRLRTFYDGEYRPDRATLMVIGDINPAAVEAKIRVRFGDWAAKAPPPPQPDYGQVARRGSSTQLVVEPGTAPSVQLVWATPYEDLPDTLAQRRHDLIEFVGLQVLNRRLERAARSDDPPFVGAAAGRDDLLRSARLTSVSVTPGPGGWKTAMTAAEHIARQAVLYGITQAEVDREVAELHATLDTQAAGAATRRTPVLAQELVRAVDEHNVFTSPAQDLALFDRSLKGVPAKEVSRILAGAFEGQGPLLSIVSPTPIPGGEAAVAAAFAAARAAPVARSQAQADIAWPYTRFGPPGRVTVRRTVADLGVTFVRFANGVRLAVRPSALHKDQVLVSVRLGHGRLGLPAGKLAPDWADGSLVLGGFGKISLEDAEQVLASKVFGADFHVNDDAFVLSGSTRPSDLDTQMQVLTALVADPGWRPAAFDRVKSALTLQLQTLSSTPQGVLARDIGKLEHGGDARWAIPSLAEVAASREGALKAELTPVLAHAPIEVVIVGDISASAAIDAVARTLAALPPRAPDHALAASALAVRFPAADKTPVTLTHDGRADQSVVLEAWPTTGLFDDPQNARAMTLAAGVMQLRLIDQLRIATGSTYAPAVGSTTSDVLPGYGFIQAEVETPPDKTAAFYAATGKIAAELAATGPTPDELERARLPHTEAIRKAQQTNEYWLIWLSGADEDPRRLDLVRQTLPGYARLTGADVQAAARRWLKPHAVWRLMVKPAADARLADADR